MSAGLPLLPVDWRLARLLAKLIGGVGRTCAGGSWGAFELEAAEGCRWVCVGGESVAGRGGGMFWGCDLRPDEMAGGGGGGGLGCREEGMVCGGAAAEQATIDRRCPPGAVVAGGIGLRLPTREGGCCFVVDEGGRSSRMFTTFTSGGTEGGTMPAVLPRLCSIRACCCCFRFTMDLTCSSAFGSSPRIVKPMTTGEMPLSTEGRLTSVLMLLIVTRRFLAGLGDVDDGGGVSVSPALCD